jgi:hypothetical protein
VLVRPDPIHEGDTSLDGSPSYVTPALQRWRRRTDTPLVVLAIGSLPLLLLELARARLLRADRLLLDAVNIAVLIAFAIDYIVELVVACERHRYVRREWSSALIVIGQALALVPSLAGFGVLRILRAGRLIGVLARLFAIGLAATHGRPNDPARERSCVRVRTSGLHVHHVGRRIHARRGRGRARPHSFVLRRAVVVVRDDYDRRLRRHCAGHASRSLVGAVTMVVGISTFAVVTAKVAEFLIRVDLDTTEDTQ